MKGIILFFVSILVRLKILTPIRVAKLKYIYKCHRIPNFKHPVDINEKINWMKFYGDTSKWPLLADKYRVREYVKECGFEDILIPLIGKWDSVEEIEWDKLPNQFVMKCNNGSGDVVICKDKSKLDIENIKKHFNKHIHEKLSVLSGEPHYSQIKPCIIAEELLDVSTQPCNSSSMVDYKLWAFNGEVKFIRCYWNRNNYYANVAIFDENWESHPEWNVWTSHYMKPKELIPCPSCFDKLKEVASCLSKGLPVARVDMYVCKDKVYFGEITMTSSGGYMNSLTQDFLNIMGQYTKLPID